MAIHAKGEGIKRRGSAIHAQDDGSNNAPRRKRQKTIESDTYTDIIEVQTTTKTTNSIANLQPKMIPRGMSAQALFLVHCRDNIVPGSIGPKDWIDVTKEFNERFKDELRRPLAWNTLQKRTGKARKLLQQSNPAYTATLQYPVPNHTEQTELNDIGLQLMGNEVAHELQADEYDPEVSEASHSAWMEDSISDFTPYYSQLQGADDTWGIQADSTAHLISLPYRHPGAFHQSSISPHNIALVDRIKYHLRRRTHEPVVFRFLNVHEAALAENDVQYIGHDTLLSTSPYYASLARTNPNQPVDVPEPFSARTVNAFIQLVSPVHAKALPTHYLWRSEVPVEGVYDRFGAISPENIHWTVYSLLELHVFARFMEVNWICDVVIDRMHWMFSEQTKLREVLQNMDANNGFAAIQGKNEFVGRQVHPVPDSECCSLAAEDFPTYWLSQLSVQPVDTQTLTFIADLMFALGGAPDDNWLSKAPSLVQEIFTHAVDSSEYSSLINASWAAFCATYHHHEEEDKPCYTTFPEYTSEQLIHELYAASSHEELVALSSHVSSPNSLASMMYKASGAPQGLRAANSTPEMLDAEKMVLEMEMRLEEAKAALWEARDAGKEKKYSAIQEAKEVAEKMFRTTQVLRK
jgi:hypothetical protein